MIRIKEFLAALSLKMIMRPDRHKEGGVLPEKAVAIIGKGAVAKRASRPLDITAPPQLDVNGGPGPPVGRVVSGRTGKPLVGEFVAEMIGYVLQMVGFKSECFRWFDAGERGRRSRESVDKRATEAPREKLVPKVAARLEYARGHHPSAEVLATLDTTTHDEHGPWHRVSFSYDLLSLDDVRYEIHKYCVTQSDE